MARAPSTTISPMVFPPLLVSLVWILIAKARDETRPLTPATTVGWVAVASLVLSVLVFVTMSLVVTVPVGLVMMALWAAARWGRHDRGLLLVLPLVCGLWTLVVPLIFE